jgi:hypothetical protein
MHDDEMTRKTCSKKWLAQDDQHLLGNGRGYHVDLPARLEEAGNFPYHDNGWTP